MSGAGADPSSEQAQGAGPALEAENRRLRARLRALTQAAARNETLLRNSGERELELLRAGSLEELFSRLVQGLRASYRLDAVTLVLHDPRHEIHDLLLDERADPRLVAALRFVDLRDGSLPRLSARARPWLGRWSATDHEPIFGRGALGSVALIPLPRRAELDGILGFGSADPARFGPELASDFLAHLGVIAALCVENAVNRARLVRAGLTDFLTGWHNRRYLEMHLAAELARVQRSHSSVVCMMIDVDHFKRINDLYGHLGGDAVLREVARRIDAELRQSDGRARFGGDEFAIVLSEVALDGGQRLAERILQAVTAHPVAAGAGLQASVTLSIGLASLAPSRESRDYKALCQQLLAQADAALYRAKAAGRNRVASAGPPP